MRKLLFGALFFVCIAEAGRAQSIFTVAGGGGDDGRPATYATLVNPFDVAVGPDGDICVADTDANRVRRVDAETGVIRTIAGDGGAGYLVVLQATPWVNAGRPSALTRGRMDPSS